MSFAKTVILHRSAFRYANITCLTIIIISLLTICQVINFYEICSTHTHHTAAKASTIPSSVTVKLQMFSIHTVIFRWYACDEKTSVNESSAKKYINSIMTRPKAFQEISFVLNNMNAHLFKSNIFLCRCY